MKPSSNRVRTIIKQLLELPLTPVGFFSRPRQCDVERAVELIKLISDSGEWPSIVCLLPLLFSPEEAIAEAAGNGVELLMKGMRRVDLLQLDERIRSGVWRVPTYMRLWETMKFDSLRRFTSGRGQVGIIGAVSCHSNGYLREAALRCLSQINDGNELPFLLIRLSDWVRPVSSVAEQLVEERINLEYGRHFLNNLALLERVRMRQRGGARRIELIEKVLSQLKQSTNSKLLLDGLQHDDYEVGRISLKLLREAKAHDPAEIIGRIIGDRDIMKRRMVLELVADLPVDEKLPVLQRLAKDSGPHIRRLALSTVCDAKSDEAGSLLREALLDKSAVVREYARFKLAKQVTPIDFRQFYLASLQDSALAKSTAAAAAGLGETGRAEDALSILPLLDHEQVGVRKSAIGALCRLAAQDYRAVFFRLLTDQSPGVSTAAASALEGEIEEIGGDSLWQSLAETSTWHVKRNILALLNRLSKWERVSFLLLAVSVADERFQELALKYLSVWEQQYKTCWQYTMPNEQQKERFFRGFQSARDRLPQSLRQTLLQCLPLCQSSPD